MDRYGDTRLFCCIENEGREVVVTVDLTDDVFKKMGLQGGGPPKLNEWFTRK